MWCVPELDGEYIERMEDVLSVYERPYSKNEPVVCLDERPIQLLDSARKGQGCRPGKVAREDYEYVRCGTANVFCGVEPQAGRHFTKATPDRKGPAFARMLAEIRRKYPHAKTIHLIMDNLSTHSRNSLVVTYGEKRGGKLWDRFTVHYTPKHASWLNQAEIEISIYSRNCLGRDRVSTFTELENRTNAWNAQVNAKRIKIHWGFTVKKARKKFNYARSISKRSEN